MATGAAGTARVEPDRARSPSPKSNTFWPVVASKAMPSSTTTSLAPSKATRIRSSGRSTWGSDDRTPSMALRISAVLNPRSVSSLAALTLTRSWNE